MSWNKTRSTRAETVRSETDLDPRTRRATNEQMDVLFTGIGTYIIHSESGNQYEVDIFETSCTCPDWQDSTTTARCKHIRRIDMEIEAGTVPRPDGRIADPSSASTQPSVLIPMNRSTNDTGSESTLVGSIPEFDRCGGSADATFWRCETCGREAIHRRELEGLTPAATADQSNAVSARFGTEDNAPSGTRRTGTGGIELSTQSTRELMFCRGLIL